MSTSCVEILDKERVFLGRYDARPVRFDFSGRVDGDRLDWEYQEWAYVDWSSMATLQL